MSITIQIERGENTYTVEAEWLAGQRYLECADREFDYTVYDEAGKEVDSKEYGYMLKPSEYDTMLDKLYED